MSRTVLIAGISGTDGRLLEEKLLRQGCTVVSLRPEETAEISESHDLPLENYHQIVWNPASSMSSLNAVRSASNIAGKIEQCILIHQPEPSSKTLVEYTSHEIEKCIDNSIKANLLLLRELMVNTKNKPEIFSFVFFNNNSLSPIDYLINRNFISLADHYLREFKETPIKAEAFDSGSISGDEYVHFVSTMMENPSRSFYKWNNADKRFNFKNILSSKR